MTASHETVTQFSARVLGIADFPPPEPRHGPRYAASRLCWLCGGDTGGRGWPQSLAIAPTFTQHNTARCGDSDAVCQSCAALTRAGTYQEMVRARGLDIKLWSQAGWHSYSHFIREDGVYSAPLHDDMRRILLDPPPCRYVLTINTSGMKHTIFRAAVASDRDYFPVQIDETTVWGRRADVTSCMADFEAMSALGFSKDDTLAGRYHPAGLLRAGLARWRPAEERMTVWRSRHPDLMAIIHLAARGPRHFAPVEPAEPQLLPSPEPQSLQAEMF